MLSAVVLTRALKVKIIHYTIRLVGSTLKGKNFYCFRLDSFSEGRPETLGLDGIPKITDRTDRHDKKNLNYTTNTVIFRVYLQNKCKFKHTSKHLFTFRQ